MSKPVFKIKYSFLSLGISPAISTYILIFERSNPANFTFRGRLFIMKGGTMKPERSLKDLNLLDRFLFAQAMEDEENMRLILEIILGREIVLKHLPQTEKEARTSPLYRSIRLDVIAADDQDNIYDTEVQKRNTRNLPRRSRYYEGFISTHMLPPGEVDFDQLKDSYVIIIAPFDIFGKDRYRYTFRMKCDEIPELALGDGDIRIFLNTRGTNDDQVSPELVELLRYMEDSSKEVASGCSSPRIHTLQERIEAIKSSEEVNVKYMQAWEERELDRREAREEGRQEGRQEILKELIRKKLAKGKDISVIAEEMEEEEETIRNIVEDMSKSK